MKLVNKGGKRQTNIVRMVVSLRDTKSFSWTKIRLALEAKGHKVSGSTVRRIYDEGKGYKGAHYDSRPLKGGRYRNDTHPDGTQGHQPKRTTSKAKNATTTAKTKAQRAVKARQGSDVSSKVTTVTKKQAPRKATATRKQAKPATDSGPIPGGARRAKRAAKATQSPQPSVEEQRREAAAEAAEG